MANITDHGRGCDSCVDDQKLSGETEKLKFVSFQYDRKNKSLDVFLKRDPVQWNNGIGLQLNYLTMEDKEALKLYLEQGN